MVGFSTIMVEDCACSWQRSKTNNELGYTVTGIVLGMQNICYFQIIP